MAIEGSAFDRASDGNGWFSCPNRPILYPMEYKKECRGEQIMMKTCPVCGSICFDDMTTCYGCMHDFSRDEAPRPRDMPNDAPTARHALTLPLVIADDEDDFQKRGRHAVNLDVTVRVEGPSVSRRTEQAFGQSA